MRWPRGRTLAALTLVAAPVAAAHHTRVAPLLPADGARVCFAAAYDPPRPVELTTARRDAVSLAPVTSLRLALDLPVETESDRAHHFARTYNLTLDTRLGDGRALSTMAQCDWAGPWVGLIDPSLFCFIDCDGGTVSLWRVPGATSLSLYFEPRERLRMSDGCGSGPNVYIGADAEARSFPMAPVAVERCAVEGGKP